MIDQMKKAHSVTTLCRLMKVSSSAFYTWSRKRTEIDADHIRLCSEVKAIARETEHSYGSRRISKELRRRGYDVGRYRAGSLMRESDVAALVPKPPKYPHSGPPDVIADNLLERQFNVEKPNLVWAGDITYIATQKGWLYLAVVLDMYSRRVIGWACSASPDTELITRALRLALQTRTKTEGLMFHSDQGCQYTSKAYRAVLEKEGIRQSMSRRGNCWDNAVVERFFRSLKTERTRYIAYPNRALAEADIRDYIAVFYNHHRLHSAANDLPPAEFEAIQKNAA